MHIKLMNAVKKNWWSHHRWTGQDLRTDEAVDALMKPKMCSPRLRDRGRSEFETPTIERFMMVRERRWLGLVLCTNWFQHKREWILFPYHSKKCAFATEMLFLFFINYQNGPKTFCTSFGAFSETETKTFPKRGNTPCCVFLCFLDYRTRWK